MVVLQQVFVSLQNALLSDSCGIDFWFCFFCARSHSRKEALIYLPLIYGAHSGRPCLSKTLGVSERGGTGEVCPFSIRLLFPSLADGDSIGERDLVLRSAIEYLQVSVSGAGSRGTRECDIEWINRTANRLNRIPAQPPITFNWLHNSHN